MTKTYAIYYGYHRSLIAVEDFECEQNALDKLIDILEKNNDIGCFIPFDELDEHHEDEYVIGGNHCLALRHDGNFRIVELV